MGERRDLKLDEVAEDRASGDVAEVYERIKSTLRTSYVGRAWRTFATKPQLLRALWDQLEPAVDRGFLEGAEGIRALAIERVREAINIEDHRPLLGDDLERASEQLRVFLEALPRDLILLCALRQAWKGDAIQAVRTREELEEGVPRWHAEIEVPTPSGDASKTLEDMQQTLNMPFPSVAYVAMARWPDYLTQAWRDLKPFVGTEAWQSATKTIDWVSEQLALALPAKIDVSPARAGELGLSDDEAAEVGEWIETFHNLLPGVIVNTSFLWLGQLGGVTPLPPPSRDDVG